MIYARNGKQMEKGGDPIDKRIPGLYKLAKEAETNATRQSLLKQPVSHRPDDDMFSRGHVFSRTRQGLSIVIYN